MHNNTPLKVDRGSDGNIMPLHIYKKSFPRVTDEQLVAKNRNIQCKTYNKTTVAQLSTCTVKIKHNNKQKICIFLVLRNGEALLGMPDIDVLKIMNTKVNTINIKDGSSTNNCYTNKVIPRSPWHEQQYANTMQETDRAEICYTSTDTISKSNNTDKPLVENKLSNTIDYFLPGLI